MTRVMNRQRDPCRRLSRLIILINDNGRRNNRQRHVAVAGMPYSTDTNRATTMS